MAPIRLDHIAQGLERRDQGPPQDATHPAVGGRREYRRRLLLAVGPEGIEMPTRALQVGEAGKPLPVVLITRPGSGSGGIATLSAIR